MKVAIQRLILALLLIGAGFIIGSPIVLQKPAPAIELGDAIPLSLNPFERCVEPNADEMALFSVAVQTLEVVQGRLNSLGIGAKQFLGSGLLRSSTEETVAVCDPEGTYDRVAHLVSEYRMLDPGRLTEYELNLAARFSKPDPYIVTEIASSAFNDSPQQSGIFDNRDIRPLARSVLAGFRDRSAEYADVAYKQMSANDSMGTSAAQIAAAAGHPLALDRIERMMADTLSALPKDGIVPWKTKRRLYELAYAFALVGERGKMHLAPLRQLMTMKVQSWAPPFGMIEHPPKRMCDLLIYIVGANSADDQAYPYCADDKIRYDQ